MASAARPSGNTSNGANLAVPRVFQFGVVLFVLLTGAIPLALHGTIGGVTGMAEGAFALALISSLAFDLLRVAPLIVLAHHPAGVLHPLNLAVVVWPLLTTLPRLIDSFGGYGGLIAGEPLSGPYFIALGWVDSSTGWTNVAIYNALQILALLTLYAGFAIAAVHPGKRIEFMRAPDPERLRAVMIGVIAVTLIAVLAFIQFRGGIDRHIVDLGQGRFRALAGLGPLLALFDAGFISLLIWIAYRPQDARSPIFLGLLATVAVQQFITAGARSSALITIVLIGLVWALRTRKLPWRLAVVLLPIAFLSFGALNLVRASGWTGSTVSETVRTAGMSEVIERSRSEFDQREALAGSVPVVVEGMRKTGPLWGYTYVGAIFAMVPRALWPEKPRGPGSIYAVEFLGQDREGTAVPISPVAEAFWNFHVPGVIVLFALYGWLLRRGHELYIANQNNGLVVAVFVLFVTQFGVGTDQLVAFQQNLITVVLVVGVLMIFMPRTLSPEPRRTPRLHSAAR